MYRLGDIVSFGQDEYTIISISKTPYIVFEDGSEHYSLMIRKCEGTADDWLVVNDAQVRFIRETYVYVEPKCKDCKFFHQLKLLKSKKPPIEFELRSCCIMLPCTEPGYDAFVLETSEDDRCEMFTEVENEEL